MKKIIAALGAVLLFVAPAQAQFGFVFGNEDIFADPDENGFAFGRGTCFTEYQLRNYLEDKGYSHVLFGVFDNAKVPVKATMDGTVYLMNVNYCSGRIISKKAFASAN